MLQFNKTYKLNNVTIQVTGVPFGGYRIYLPDTDQVSLMDTEVERKDITKKWAIEQLKYLIVKENN